ncbi:MAG: molybdenum cofactor biosynthesis protein MoaB [Deltaproteobacteria bacterium]|nr:molybdenum cofactor biosynthesis protein MoaB [Deltaproteobacteria bacterium]
MSTSEHKKTAPARVSVAVISVSTTRTLETDKSGHWIAKRAKKEGHTVVHHQVIPDDAAAISAAVLAVIRERSPQAILLTGGTGISPKDVTIEAVRSLFKKELTAFGPIFAQLSFEEIDSAAMLSRAAAGIIGNTVVFCMPGSLGGCKLACKALIFPELGHIVRHLDES